MALALCFPAFHLYPLAWLALSPLFYQSLRRTSRENFLHFFLAGWVFYSVLWHWLAANVYWAGGWALLGQQLLCVFLALYWGVFGVIWTRIRGTVPPWAQVPCAAMVWAAMEHLQGRLFTGFGGGALAYSQGLDLPLLQWVAVGGVPLLSAILLSVNVLVALTAASPKGRIPKGLAAIAVVLISHALGNLMLDEADYTSKPLSVGIIQSNFPVEMKHDWEYSDEMVRNTMEKTLVLAQNEDLDLVVWPEALIMNSIDKPYVRDALATVTQQGKTALFTGAARSETDPYRAFNSAYFVEESGEVAGYYDKMHLAPFGEYVPLAQFLPFLNDLIPAIGEVSAGEELKVFSVKERTLGPLICFEVLFPEMAEALRRGGADFLVVVTNLGWFGASNALLQELEVARVRAVETRLPLVHSANTGISGVFDPMGRLTFINTMVDQSGNYLALRSDLTAAETRGLRLAGVFSIAAPGNRPIPHGPSVFPWLTVAATGLLLIVLAALGRRRKGA